MAIAYAFARVMSGRDDGVIESVRGMRPEKAIEHFMKPGRMKGHYLGACLDSCRLGSMTTCYWPMDVRGLMGLIERWKEENNDNEAIYHEEPIEGLWKKFELPWINHQSCPREKGHRGTILDAFGRVRCAHKEVKMIRPSFHVSYYSGWDHHSQMPAMVFYEDEPCDPCYEDDRGDLVEPEDYDEYLQLKAKFDAEEPKAVADVCYSIIREPRNKPMAFETILMRENIHPETRLEYCGSGVLDGGCKVYGDRDTCFGHDKKTNAVEFTFDGWTLAHYALKWKQQGPNAPWFADKIEHWPSRGDLRICSED